MNRKQFGALTAGALAGYGLRASAQGADTFRFGAATAESFALAVYANEAGFFAKHGLAPNVLTFSGGGPGITALAGGAVDYVCGSWVATANAHANGIPMVAFAGGALYTTDAPNVMLAVAKDNTAVKSGKDLNGKTISVATIRDIQQAAIMKWIDATGGDASTVKFVEMPAAEMVNALNSGHIDAASMAEPFLTSGKANVRLVTKSYDVIAKRFMVTAHFALRDYLTKNVALTRRVTAALAETAAWANANQAAAGVILARLSKIPPETIAAMARTQYTPNLDMRLIAPVIAAAQERNFVNRSVVVSDMLWSPPN